MSIDLVNANGVSVFMFTDDYGYTRLPSPMKNYSVQKHIVDTKAEKYRDPNFWRERASTGGQIGRIILRVLEEYWNRGVELSIVDVGSQYFFIGFILAKYIKACGHHNKIYAFDCGAAGRLTNYNIKLNQLAEIIRFEFKVVSNRSIPHLVYSRPGHSEDNHILKRKADSELLSEVVDGVTLDDFFLTGPNNNVSNENLIIKIDAQGAEPLIFSGMEKLLNDKKPPCLIFEFVPNIFKTLKDPLEFLEGLPEEYLLYNLDNSKSQLESLRRDGLVDFINTLLAKQKPWTDILMLHKDIAAQMTSILR